MNFNIVYICTCTLYMVKMVKARIRRILDREKEMKKIVLRVGTLPSFYNNLFSKNLYKNFFCFQWTQKKGFAIFPSPAGMSLSKLSPAGDGKIANLFFTVPCILHPFISWLSISEEKKLYSPSTKLVPVIQAFIFAALTGQWTMSCFL